MAQPADLRTPNTDLVALRDNAGLSQEDLADALNELAQRRFGRQVEITKKTVGRWERGEVAWPQPFYRRLLAEYCQVAVDELGFRRPRPAAPELHRRASTIPDDLLTLVAAPTRQDLRVEKDQQQWRDVRDALGQRRQPLAVLAVLAEQLYPDHQVPGLEHTGVIAHPAWLPDEPIPLGQVVLDRVDDAPPPAVSGSERESAAVRPLASAEKRYRRYSHAVRNLAAPRLFENRLCFRLLGVDWSRPAVQLDLGAMGFFDAIDTNEALAHETALHHLAGDAQGKITLTKPSWRRLVFRRLVGDPFNLARRPLMGAVSTLTIRAGESPCMVLHKRDGDNVAGGGGMITELFATMNDSLASGALRVYCLGRRSCRPAPHLAAPPTAVPVLGRPPTDRYRVAIGESLSPSSRGAATSRNLMVVRPSAWVRACQSKVEKMITRLEAAGWYLVPSVAVTVMTGGSPSQARLR